MHGKSMVNGCAKVEFEKNKRKKWSAQYTITVGDKQVRKTNYKCK